LKYRKFGNLDWNASVLGFGAMRLPFYNNDNSKIDEAKSIEMIRYAIDNGVNYIDSAYVYHGGNSETLVGKALKDGYRDKVRVATKLPVWLVNTRDDLDKYFEDQLKRLQVQKIDFYLLHSLDTKSWAKVKELNIIEWAEKRIKKGQIGYLGFSFHAEYDLFKEIVDAYQWTFCQIQYNYLDENYQAGVRGLKYAASKGLGVVVMEPIAGGRLAVHPPEEVQKLWDSAKVKRSPAEWALQWVWNQPEVSLLLSGMSTIQQITENIESADRSGPDKLNDEDLKLIKEASKKYKELNPIGCSACRYCMPCPNGVAIPEIFAFYNEYFSKNADDSVKARFKQTLKPEQYADNCVKCGKCEQACPQHLRIIELLEQTGVLLAIER
jgi:predicted aldo/keto reductase-like oxidoreductase